MRVAARSIVAISIESSIVARRLALAAGRAWHIKRALDADAMSEAAQVY